MAKTNHLLKDEHQRQFAKLLDGASRRHSRWNTFTDFIHASALKISNGVDPTHREERQKEYERITKDYDKDELACFQGMFDEVVAGLEANTNQDFMGSLFMNLELGDRRKGQFFYSVQRQPYDGADDLRRGPVES